MGDPAPQRGGRAKRYFGLNSKGLAAITRTTILSVVTGGVRSQDSLVRDVNIAEHILALVTTDDRAASIVGDLTEGIAARGMFWFWPGVLRTAASLLWRNVAEEPGRFTRQAFLSLAVYIGLELVFSGLR
jgi:hypothetical protein